MRRLGVFGGSFDPVHFGHLRIAEEFRELCALQSISLIPTANPPHRNPLTAAEHRLNMLRLAVADHPAFEVDEREIHRDKPCYTIDTLQELSDEVPQDTLLHWLIGADSFLLLHTWRRWVELLDIGVLAVACRPGFDLDRWQDSAPDELRDEVLPRIQILTVPQVLVRGTIAFLPTTPLAISATAIRRNLAEQRSVRYLVPDAVRDYAERHLLYRS